MSQLTETFVSVARKAVTFSTVEVVVTTPLERLLVADELEKDDGVDHERQAAEHCDKIDIHT